MDTIRIKLNLKHNKPIDEYVATEQMKEAMENMVKLGALKGDPDKILKNYDIILGPTNYIIMDIQKDAYVDGAILSSVGAEKISSQDIPEGPSLLEANRSFSAASIKERLRISNLDPKVRFRYTILDYKKFFSSNKDKLLGNPVELRKLRDLFLSDLMSMFNVILPEIQDGKQLSSLLGLQSVAPSIGTAARELSVAYKKALMTEQSTGAPTAASYKLLVQKYNIFLNELLPIIFPGIEQVEIPQKDQGNVNETKTQSRVYSRLSDNRIDLWA